MFESESGGDGGHLGLLKPVEKLDEIPGIGIPGARVIIAEVGVEMSRFPTAAHLSSWVRFAPRGQRIGRSQEGQRHHRPRQPLPARVLGEAAVAAGKTATFLGERYRRIAKPRGKKRAIVAVGRSILNHRLALLSDPDLGSDYYDNRTGPERTKRNHIRQLEALWWRSTLR